MNLLCWAVPTREGYVLRADHSVASLFSSAPSRNPQFWGWNITVAQPKDQMFSAPLARRAALLAVDHLRHASDFQTFQADENQKRVWWSERGLGFVLILVSGGHWVPALAGIWLLAGRRWLRRLIGLDAGIYSLPFSPTQETRVSSDMHAGLAKVSLAIDGIDDALVAYAAAASYARAEGLDQVAEVYDLLAGGVHPAQLPPDLGFWVGNEIVHDVLRPALPSPRDEQDSSSSDDSEESKTR